MKKAIAFLFIIVGIVAVQGNPLPTAEVNRISAYPPEISIMFNIVESDTFDLSGFHVFTSQGTATINDGVYLIRVPDDVTEITLDSSNTSGFIINHEADSVFCDIEMFGFPALFEYEAFGNLGSQSPPNPGCSVFMDAYKYFYPESDLCWIPFLSFDFSTPNFGYTDVMINEINAHSTWGANSSFIELYNKSDYPVDLDGWRLVCDTVYDLPSDAVIPPYGYYVIDEKDFPAAFDMDADADNIYLINPNAVVIYFWTINGPRTVDQVGWSSDHGENVSFMRYPDGDVDTSPYLRYGFTGYNDQSSITFENGFPTRGAANRHDCPGFVTIGVRVDSLDDSSAKISWTDPIWDAQFDYSVLVKSTDAYPTTPNDGNIIYEGIDQEFIDEVIVPDVTNYYAVFAKNLSGEYSLPTGESQGNILFHAMGISDVNLPEHISTLTCYPNPFNARTTISFSLAQAGHVEIAIYDITGRLVTTLADRYFEAGKHSSIWQAGDVPSGVYFVRLQANGLSYSKNIVLLK